MTKSGQSTPSKQPVENWDDLLNEFIQKGGRGLQKTFIKKLWAVHEDLLASCNQSTLRMMFFSPALTVSPEGVKLVASILLKIGGKTGLILLYKLIMQFELTDNECQRYGDVFKSAWKKAFQDGNFDLTEELETEVFTAFCRNAIYGQKPICGKFRKILTPFATEKKLDKNLDTLMTSLLNGCLFTALGANNYLVQTSAAEVLFMFYPLVGEESDDMAKAMEQQHRHMADLLRSDVIAIRTEAVRSVVKALAEYWLIIPKHVVKELLGYVIDTLSRDTVVAVRAAVFEGLSEMAFVPACLTVFEHSLKCVAGRGIQDKSERVRLVAFQLLARLKNHKFISVFDIIERDEAIAKLDIETVESCRRQLIPIMHILLPISSKNLDESYYRPRVNYLLSKSRLALLTYFRLLGPMKIIEAAQAHKLIEMLVTWAYRYLRKKDGPPLAEDSDGYKKARVYLECALILYMSCKGMFMMDANATLKSKIDSYFGKVVKEIFEKYANTPILGTATAISSVIPKDNLKSIANDVLGRLADDDVPDEAVEPFLESAVHFNPESIFDSFDAGLKTLVDLFAPSQKPKKAKHNAETPEEVMATTLKRLKYMLQSHSTANLVTMRDVFRMKIADLFEKVDLIREAIEQRLSRNEGEESSLSDATLLSTLEMRFILPLFVAVNGDDSSKAVFESTKSLLAWFDERIAKKMVSFPEHNQDFLIELTRTFLESVNVILSAYDFTTKPVEYENEEERPEQEEAETSVAEVATRVVLSFCSSSTPIELFAPVLRVASTLCEESYSECHEQIANVLRFVPKWINKQCDEMQDEENLFEKDKDALEALRQLQKRVSDTECWDETAAGRMIHHFVVFSIVALTTAASEQEYEDPRREEYKPPHFLSFAVNKFILKDKTLTTELLAELSNNYLADGSKFLNSETAESTNTLLTKLAALSQLLRILEQNTKFCERTIKEGVEKCTEKALYYFANCQDLDTVEDHVMNSLTALLDVDLPEGF